MRAVLLGMASSGLLTTLAAVCAAAPVRQIEAAAPAIVTAEAPDPFQPAVPRTDERRDLPPLERVTLDEFRLVATVRGVGMPRALIEDASGLGFITVVGNVVGVERHKIVAIADGYITLEPAAAGAPASRVVTRLGHQLARE